MPGPHPPFANVVINAQFYSPSRFVISAVSLGGITTVTTSTNHNYLIGQLVRLIFPFGYGCTQLNEKSGYVMSIPALNQVTLNLSSFNVDAFIAANLKQQPQITAIGDVNYGQTNATGITNQGLNIPGSFINISPL